MSVFKVIQNSIEEAIKEGLISDENKVLTGFSGKRMMGALQRLSKNLLKEDTCYLEVGVFQGLTLLSVAKELGDRHAYGIDNFAFFDKEGKNHDLVKDRMEKLSISNAHIINKDYEDALENLDKELNGKKVGVYFIDGPHDYRSQLMCLALIKPHLAKNAVIIIDDSNYRHVRQANKDFLVTHPEFKLIFQSYTKAHPLNLSGKDRKEAEEGWWDGVNVIVHDPENELETIYPPTYRKRTLYENEHIIHASKSPETMIGMLKFAKVLAPVVKMISKKEMEIEGKYELMNTYSEGLPHNQFNASLKK